MAIKIKFDEAHNVIPPTFILTRRNGSKLGLIPAKNIEFKGVLNGCSELSFAVNKISDGVEYDKWDELKDFKLLYCRDWDTWFEIYVEISESSELVKNVTAKTLGEAELSQTNLYNIEINTEDDIARDDYVATVLFNEEDEEGSLLHRITEKIPNYTITHVDSSIANIQRTFTFDDISIYDAFQEIAEEIDCIFIIGSNSNEEGLPERTISVYDLESYCYECGNRENFSTSTCPECGSENITYGYGTDTAIYVCSENLAEGITYTTDVDSVKNCFKLEAGDDLMTATLVNCNPNGSGYIWYISDDLKEDMSDELVEKLADYDEDYDYYYNEYEAEVDSDTLASYNAIVEKYSEYSDDYSEIESPIVGYPALMQAYYDTIDLYLYLNDSLMPSVTIADTSAALEVAQLSAYKLSPVAVQDLDKASKSTADSAVLAMAKILFDSRYKVTIEDSAYSDYKWTGCFTLENYSDEDDTATSKYVTVVITDDYEEYVKEKLEKSLNKSVEDYTDIIDIFDMSLTQFKAHIKKYGLVPLNDLHDACQACIDIMIEQGVATEESWDDDDNSLYGELYLPYYNKLLALEDEIIVRESEISIIVGSYDSEGDVATYGLQMAIEDERDKVQEILNFESYLGTDLWKEFLSYRREDTYLNSNYISDGLDNAEIFANALEFIEFAKKEIYKSANLQHSITSTLKNLLVMEEFEPIVDNFELGNWIRIRIDDELYKLRLIEYTINFDNLSNISITFSDVKNVTNGLSDLESILNQVQSMTTSYDSVSQQATQGTKTKTQMDSWVNDGLALTKMKIVDTADNQNISWDSHGFLCQEYLPITDTYSDKKLKIINRGIYLTDDNWLTAKAGLGDFTFYNPETQEYEEAYGVIADVLVGNLILSEDVGIYNTNNSITLNENGLIITTNGSDSESLTMMTLQRIITDDDGNEAYEKIMYVDDEGNLVLNGSIRINSVSSSDEYVLDDITDTSKIQEIVDEEINSELYTDEYDEDGNIIKQSVYSSIDQKYQDSIDYANSILEDYIADVGQYMTFDENGLTLGASSSEFSTVIDNSGMYFKQGGTIVSYVNNNQLYIPNAVIESSLCLGQFFFSPREDGGVSLTWQGD